MNNGGTEHEERESERLRAENAVLRAELDRMRTRYETPVVRRSERPTAVTKPAQFALVGPKPGKSEKDHRPDGLWDSAGPTLCRILEERTPDIRWSYYRDDRLVPEGVTYFYALDALRKLWGARPGDLDPPIPKGYHRLTATEREERDSVLHVALRRIDEVLERSKTLHECGQEVAAVGLLKHADVLLARFKLALARSQAGDSGWQEALSDPIRDAKFEGWVATQIAVAANPDAG